MTRPDCFSRIHFVLVNTTHAGNIGAAARAMKTMGFTSLRLVEPCRYLTKEAIVRASGAAEILQQALVFSTLAEALSDCTCVFGTSARSRTLESRVLSVREAASLIATRSQPPDAGGLAVVFGRERSGLTNEELALCDHRLSIPCNPQFSSLNLGSAVQVVAYEVRQSLSEAGGEISTLQGGGALKGLENDDCNVEYSDQNQHIRRKVSTDADAPEVLQPGPSQFESDYSPADNQSMELFFEHLRQTLIELEFLDPEKPRLLMPRLRRYFMRKRPERTELNILRGILTAAQKAVRNATAPESTQSESVQSVSAQSESAQSESANPDIK